MSKFTINVRQTITYDHEIVVECDENDLDAALDKLCKHSDDGWFNDYADIATELSDNGIKVIDTVEDGSGRWEFEFDYDEVSE